MAKKKLTKKQIEILYECWKEGNNTKERLVLIEKNLPGVSPLVALGTMRSLAKTDTKWLKMATRKKNVEEKEKNDKQEAKEKKKLVSQKKKEERVKKKEERDKIKSHKEQIQSIKSCLNESHFDKICEILKTEYFFCPDIDQYVNNISCLYRVFGEHPILDTKCLKCSRMNKYIPEIEEITNGRQKEIRRHRTSKKRSKVEEEDAFGITKGSGSTESNS